MPQEKDEKWKSNKKRNLDKKWNFKYKMIKNLNWKKKIRNVNVRGKHAAIREKIEK